MENVCNQVLEGNESIIGLMVESNLEFGRQDIPENLKDLKYGVSVTDGCIDWDTTATALRSMHSKLKPLMALRRK